MRNKICLALCREICKTCHSKLLKEQVPCQAVYNKLMVDETPPELECLEKLEQILISQRTLRFINFGPNIQKWISVLYSDVESGAINGGYMTNYFRVSRGVRQGCPLSPLLFVLCVELLAQKIRQNPEITGIELPNSIEAKLSQFADDTTLICKDTMSLRGSMSVLGSFGEISGLKLNSKKTKAMWIGSLKNNKTKPLEIDVPADPIKTLGTYLSNDRDKNNNLNFYLKIQKMETKLNIWLSRDLTLMGRTLLAKTLGVSKLV